MKNILIAVALTMTLAACSDAENTARVLSNDGYTQVKTNGYSWFGCDKGDNFSTKFTATNPAGKEVSGVVCSGWLKGHTIRFD